MEDVLGLEFSEIYATGGGQKTAVDGIKCSVAKPINIPAIREAILLGQRSLAVSALEHGSYREAVAAAHRVEQRYLPDKELPVRIPGSVPQIHSRSLVREVSRIVGDF